MICKSFLFDSQTYTISVSEYKLYTKNGDVNYQEVLNEVEFISDKKETDTKHILDFEKNICSYFIYGVFINSFSVLNQEKLGNTEIITLQDYDSENNPVLTYFVLDSESNQFYYYWYNVKENVTKLESKIQFSVEIIDN